MGVVWKVVPAAAGSRTFAGLVPYATDNQLPGRPRDVFDDRVTYATRTATIDPETGEAAVRVLAIQSQGVQSVRTAAVEMQAVADQCPRLRKAPDLHLILSWRDGERPTETQAFDAGRHALAALGMGEHQYVMAVHIDTENVHLHIVANRVHPETFRAVDLYRDYVKLDLACREIELMQGWSHEAGIHRVDGQTIVRPDRHIDPDAPAPLGGRGPDMRAWSDEQPFAEWVQVAAADMKAILNGPDASWAQLHARLAEFNLRLESKGSGLIVVDREDPQLVAKASQIGRFTSRARLEAQLGPFQPDVARTPATETPGDRHRAALPRAEEAVASATQTTERVDASARGLSGYLSYLVDDDEHRRAARGAELVDNPRLVIDDLFERSATITTNDIRRAVRGQVANAQQADRVWEGVQSLVDDGALLAVQGGTRTSDDANTFDASQRWTTPEMIALERELDATIDVLRARAPRSALEVEASRIDAMQLRSGQREALTRMLRGETFVVMEGHAGAGKSYVFGKARDIMDDVEFRGLAQSGQAASELKKTTGIASQTIASFVRDVRNGTLVPHENMALVLDETNMVGTRDLLDVLAIARTSNTLLYVTGDNSQLPGVAAGAAFRLLTDRLETTTIGDVVRLTGWRADAAEYARSPQTVARMLAMHAERGFVHETPTVTVAIDRAVELWDARTEPLALRLLIAFRNDDVDLLNTGARDALRARGFVTDEVSIATQRHGVLEIGVGERIAFGKNDAQFGVMNGTLGTVVTTSGNGLRVRLDGNDAREIDVDTTAYGDLAYGYAVTHYKAEGMTLDHAIWYATRADDLNSAYVAVSRSRGDCDIVLAQEEFHFQSGSEAPQDYQRNLAFLLQRSRVKDLALDYDRAPAPRPLRSAADVASDHAARYTMRPADDAGTAGIRRRGDQQRFAQWFSTGPGTDIRAAMRGDDELRSWDMVHAILQANGVEAHRHGNGLVFADVDEPDRFRVKASSLPRAFHSDELEKAVGPYTAPSEVGGALVERATAQRDDRESAAQDRGPDDTVRRYKRDPVRRAQQRAVRAAARAGLYRRFVSQRSNYTTVVRAWAQQRAGERDRHDAITQEKRAIRNRMTERLGARAAASIAAAWAVEQREALRAQITDERAALRDALDHRPAKSWRQFVVEEAEKGDPAAQSTLRGMKYQERPDDRSVIAAPPAREERNATGNAPREERETAGDAPREDAPRDGGSAPEGAGDRDASSTKATERDRAGAAEERVIEGPADERKAAPRNVSGLRYKIEKNGDISYSFSGLRDRVMIGEAFRDRGNRITIESNSPQAIRAAVAYAKESWGNAPVTLRVNDASRDAILKEAARSGLNVQNPELRRHLERYREQQQKPTITLGGRDARASQEKSGRGVGDGGRKR